MLRIYMYVAVHVLGVSGGHTKVARCMYLASEK